MINSAFGVVMIAKQRVHERKECPEPPKIEVCLLRGQTPDTRAQCERCGTNWIQNGLPMVAKRCDPSRDCSRSRA
eukprot:787851-Rhodomonas_salina.1